MYTNGIVVARRDPVLCLPISEALTAAGVAHEIELYTGKLHGFAVPDMGVYDAEAARQHHERVLALFAATLG